MADGPPTPDAGATPLARARLLPWILAFGALVRGVVALRTPVINTDGPKFLGIAEGFLRGDWAAATREGFHPLYSALVALAGGSEAGAVAISLLAGVAAGWPLWLLVRDLAGARAAFFALVGYELHPAFVDIQSSVFADGVFALLAMSAMCGALRFVHSGRGLWLATAAAALGFLAKSEGLILVALTGVTLAVGVVRRIREPGVALRAAGALLLFLAVTGAYIGHLSATAGRFRYSPKGVVELAVGHAAGEEVGAGAWGRRRQELGPWVSSSWYLGRQVWHTAGFHLAVVVAALALLGKWGAGLGRKRWIAAWIVGYLLCVWWTNFRTGHQISDRYLHPPLAWAFVLLGPFAAWAVPARSGGERWPVLAIVGLVLLGLGGREAATGRRGNQVGLREAGEWILQRHGGPGATVSCPVDKVPYYARARWVGYSTKAPDAAYWVFTDQDAAKDGWDWRTSDLGPFRLAESFPASPSRGDRVVRVFVRGP